MNRNDFSADLFANIEISADTKKKIYRNCLKGKRAGDLRFRYASVLTALIGVTVFACTGAGAYAAYQSVQTRLESMPQQEVQEYVQDLSNTPGVKIDDAYSRKLTDEETLRVAELERKYNTENEFPEENVQRVKTFEEWDGESVCYVEEDNTLYFPDEMSDEDLLTFIDYSTKKDYVMEQEAERIAEEEGLNTPSPYMDVEDISEEELIKIGRDALDKLFGKDVASDWNVRTEAFKPSAANPEYGTSHDHYYIYWEQPGGSSMSMDYVVCLNMDDLSLCAVAVRGREHFASLKSYSDADAELKLEADKEKMYAELERLYGFKNPDRERQEVYYDYTDPGENDARQGRYVMYFGNLNVDILWDFGTEKIASIEFFDE